MTAQRTYKSLKDERGFLGFEDTLILPDIPPRSLQLERAGGATLVSICPMTDRTYWRHVGTGRWDADAALYEKVTT